MMIKTVALALSVSPVVGADVTFITFDGASNSTFKFIELNDPVMGGESVGTWQVNATAKIGIFDGEVKDVPSLKAPGFIKTAADGNFLDVSSAFGGDLVLNVRTTTPTFAGYRVSFCAGSTSGSYACAGGGQIPFSRGCFKAKFSVAEGSDFAAVRIPFNMFSDLWSPATGEQTKTCAEDASACPTAKDLSKITHFEVWAEGALGLVHLEVESVAASPTSSALPVSASPPAAFDTCSGPIQKKLNYGISTRTTAAGIPVAVNPDESLADAVCCDSRVMLFAEPQFLFQAPDIALYSKMDNTTTTVFYDSVCGLPVFQTPINRSFTDFQADTNEHGWPSFRTAEVFTANVVTDMTTGFVTSSCGTHLGSYLPDAQGPRWCIDLSCISGHKA